MLRNDDGSYDPLHDRYFNLGALEQRYPRDVGTYLDAGDHSWGLFDHFWWNHGYVELAWGLYLDEDDLPHASLRAAQTVRRSSRGRVVRQESRARSSALRPHMRPLARA